MSLKQSASRLVEKLRPARPKPPVGRQKITVQVYRAAFSTQHGRMVLTWLLERCGLFKRIETEEQRVLHNWGIELMENMAMTQALNYQRLVDQIFSFPIPAEAIDDDGGDDGRV